MIETTRSPAVHDQALVEAEIDGNVVTFRAVVVNAMPAALWLGLIKADSLLEQLRPGDPITLTFHREEAAMVARSAFLSHLGSRQSRVFSVEMPTDCRLVQRRTHIRLDAEHPIEYTVVGGGETGPGIAGAGTTRNISAGGLQFMVSAPLLETVVAGDALELRLALGRDAVLLEADVVRVIDVTNIGPDGRPMPPTSPPRPPRTLVAVRFVSISDGAQDLIVRRIFALQRLRREGPRRSV
jgi:c-di-GMP-binding flagellar brake protein YcgR